MDTTIRNIAEDAYQLLRTWAAHRGIGIGEALSQIILDHVQIPSIRQRRVSFWDVKPWDWGPGNERVSEEVDQIVYDEAQE